MAFCICQPLPCEGEGLTSVTINGSSSSKIIPGTKNLAPGPTTGSISVTGYAFEKGDKDKWLGVRCPSTAQASQSNYIRYNACSDQFIVIPSRVNSAVTTGDEMDGVGFTKFSDCADVVGFNANVQNGVTIAQRTIARFGHGLKFRDFEIPDIEPKEVFGVEPCYIQSININSSFPQPAQFNVTYQFVVKC